VQATIEANQILSDPLSQNIHNLPTGKNEFFSGGAYHIVNTEGNAVAVVLPQQNFTVPNAYTLTMWEVKTPSRCPNRVCASGMPRRSREGRNWRCRRAR
jgi:hypothetical protein